MHSDDAELATGCEARTGEGGMGRGSNVRSGSGVIRGKERLGGQRQHQSIRLWCSVRDEIRGAKQTWMRAGQ